MLNQKGQAFSVFELMIAAVVAIAILFVLLPIISGITTGGSSARDSIINTLSTYKNGGSGSSTPFTLRNGEIISSSDFSDKGFDKKGLLFATIEDLENLFTLAGGSEGDELSQIQYIGSTNFPAKAQIYCQVTGELLATTLENFEVEYVGAEVPGICEESTYQPCCLVIIKRG